MWHAESGAALNFLSFQFIWIRATERLCSTISRSPASTTAHILTPPTLLATVIVGTRPRSNDVLALTVTTHSICCLLAAR